MSKEKSLIVAYYYLEKDAKDFVKELEDLNLVKDKEGFFINLITGQRIILFSSKKNFNSLRGYNKTILIVSDLSYFFKEDKKFLKKENKRLSRLSNNIWDDRNQFIGSIISYIQNQIELEKLIKEIESEI